MAVLPAVLTSCNGLRDGQGDISEVQNALKRFPITINIIYRYIDTT